MDHALLALYLAAAPAPTRVVTFEPPMPVRARVQRGDCWTNSIAVDRRGAWRCMSGNEIHDPCFSAGHKDEVVCGANPAKNQPGFVMHLDRPLPPEVKHGTPSPWLIQLDDGTVCEAVTGTLPPVAGDPARWACPTKDPKVYSFLSSIHRGKIWTAQRFELAPDPKQPDGFIRKDPRSVSIRAVWQ